MRYSLFLSIVISVSFLAGGPAIVAFETDQYNLPPEPLADIGDEVTEHVEQSIIAAIAKVNTDITLHQSCLDKTAGTGIKCRSAESETKKLAYLHSEEAIASAVYDQLGDGSIFITVTGKWFNKHKFEHEPSRYKTTYADSIFITHPIDYATISSTVNLYGVEFGVDKIDHFFQQGYKYYKIYNSEISEGKTPADAAKKAVSWGKRTERTYFGILVSGVYSNADLYSNYAGMRFYQGLTKLVKIGDVERPATVRLNDGVWTINKGFRETLIKPFISDQLNEALNASGYSILLYPTVKRVVRNQACPEWRKRFPDLTHAAVEKRSADLKMWNGEDYGFTNRSLTVPIAVCFEEKLPTQ
jgi:hypothetical protein